MAPELAVRQLVHALGFRFRLHRRDLPGRPDLVLARHRKVILVHGCFWHQHDACGEGRVPGSRREYWGPKLAGNRRRDARNLRALQDSGWDCLVVWECETEDPVKLHRRITAFMRRKTRSTGLSKPRRR